MDVKNDIMIMNKLVKGLIIKAKSETVLKPGGYHLMFLNLNNPVKITNSYKVNLFFELPFAIKFPLLRAEHNHLHGCVKRLDSGLSKRPRNLIGQKSYCTEDIVIIWRIFFH